MFASIFVLWQVGVVGSLAKEIQNLRRLQEEGGDPDADLLRRRIAAFARKVSKDTDAAQSHVQGLWGTLNALLANEALILRTDPQTRAALEACMANLSTLDNVIGNLRFNAETAERRIKRNGVLAPTSRR